VSLQESMSSIKDTPEDYETSTGPAKTQLPCMMKPSSSFLSDSTLFTHWGALGATIQPCSMVVDTRLA
jgi:hypothetical protein